ncbi:MAG: phage head closure protein [Pseudomonadota bacterium]
MQPGEMNEIITFQRVTYTPDGGGGSVESWSAVGAVSWAAVVAKTGGEQIRAMQVSANVMYDVTVYTRRDITTDDRILRGNGDVLRIRMCDPATNAAFMTLLAEKVTV